MLMKRNLQRMALEAWMHSHWMESRVFRNPEQEDEQKQKLKESKVRAENDKQAAVSSEC